MKERGLYDIAPKVEHTILITREKVEKYFDKIS
jgi:hypothetical protein